MRIDGGEHIGGFFGNVTGTLSEYLEAAADDERARTHHALDEPAEPGARTRFVREPGFAAA